MESLHITRRIDPTLGPNVDPKQLLRAQVDKMPVAKQIEFVKAAFQLMADRIDLGEVDLESKSRLLH
jgi:hypothetical protein